LGIEEAVVFADIPEADEDDAEEYIGLVVSSDWDEDELLGIVEEETTVDEDTYKDVPFYTVGEDDAAYVATLDDGTYAVADDAEPVRDVVDVSVGDSDHLGGELYDELESIRAGHISYAAEFPSSYFEDDPAAEEFDLEPFEEITVVGGTYFTEDDEVGLTANVRSASEDDAEEVEDAIDGLVSASSLFLPEEFDDFLDPIEVERDGESVEVIYRENVDSVVESVRGLEEFTDDEREQSAIPQAGVTVDYDASADEVEVTVVDDGNVDSLRVEAGDRTVEIEPEAGARETIDVSDVGTPVVVIGSVDGNEASLLRFDGHLDS